MNDTDPVQNAARRDLTHAMREVLSAVAEYNTFVERHAEEHLTLVGRIGEAVAEHNAALAHLAALTGEAGDSEATYPELHDLRKIRISSMLGHDEA